VLWALFSKRHFHSQPEQWWPYPPVSERFDDVERVTRQVLAAVFLTVPVPPLARPVRQESES
jgi:hypothetical protein